MLLINCDEAPALNPGWSVRTSAYFSTRKFTASHSEMPASICCSITSPAAKDGSSPSHRARVPVYWNHTDKRTDFTPGEVTLFGYFRQQRSSRHGANTFNTAQSLSKLFEVAMDMAVHVSI